MALAWEAFYNLFRCPISGGIMTDPVIIHTDENGDVHGVSYDMSLLEGRHPRTGLPLQENDYARNNALRFVIEAFSPPPQPLREADGGEETHGPQE